MTTEINEVRFEFIDISNIVTLKRKWLHFFQEVTLVTFVVSLSEYDHTNEDGTNRMQESLRWLRELIGSPFLYQVSLLVLFSKTDLFEEKIKKVPLSVCFPEYTGGENCEEAKEYIRQRFTEANSNKHTYTHLFTQHISSQSLLPSVIFNAARDCVLAKCLAKAKFDLPPPKTCCEHSY